MFKKNKFITVDYNDVINFEKIAEQWWDLEGKFRLLHKLNPIRLEYIHKKIFEYFNIKYSKSPYKRLKILDIGCGGGILTEPMSRLGAEITGIDVVKKNIEIAITHAKNFNLKINYYTTTLEDLVKTKKKFDVILNMEVIEHVSNVSLFLLLCRKILKHNGIMFISTINRNIKSFIFAIIGAEYILGWLSKGTHNWNKFITPIELKKINKKINFIIMDEIGIKYNVLYDKFNLSQDKSINYIQLYKKI